VIEAIVEKNWDVLIADYDGQAGCPGIADWLGSAARVGKIRLVLDEHRRTRNMFSDWGAGTAHSVGALQLPQQCFARHRGLDTVAEDVEEGKEIN